MEKRIRQTSINTYYEIEANGLLSKRRFETYQILFNNGPMTANEIDRYYLQHHPGSYYKGLAKRLSELRDVGVIQEIGTKKDIITNQTCIVWDVTDNLPNDFKRVSKDQRIKEIISDIENFGKKLPPFYRPDLRKIYYKLKEL